MQNVLEEIPLEEIPSTPPKDTGLTQNPKNKSGNLYLYAIAIVANLLAFSVGETIGWPTPVIPKLLASSDNPLGRVVGASETAWIASLVPLGATTGPFVTKMADKIGRKKMLLCLGSLQVVALLIAIFAKTIYLYYCSRFLAGVASGTVFPVLAMFLAEISENHNRGALTCTMSIFVSMGLNFVLIIGPYLPIQLFCLVSMIPLLIFLPAFLILSPETPTFLASINDEKNLTQTLVKLRNKTSEEVNSEMTDILERAKQSNEADGTIKTLLTSKASLQGMIICVGLVVLQQASGYAAIFAYMPEIFETAGGDFSPAVSTMIVGAFQVVGTLLSAIIVDRVGRRFLLLASSAGMSTTLGLIGLYFYLQIEWLSWLPVLCLVIFIVKYSIGLGPVTWTVIAELFPANIRSIAVTIISVTCFTTTFTVCLTFPLLSMHLGLANCFFLFSSVCFVGTVFIYWILPETKGRSFEEIQKLLEGS